MDCYRGFSDCDKKQLTLLEQQEVARAHRIQNFESCGDGLGACDTTLLTDKQRQQVAEIARVGNFQSCWTEPGFATTRNSPKTRNKRWKNNLQNCLEGMDDCNRARLSSEEPQEVAREAHHRGCGTASTVRMPAIQRSSAAPSSATSR